MDTINADLCIIGAGSAGLSVAAVTAQMGLRVVLIESGKMGGDCLNYGCVPSKSLIASGKRAQMFFDAHLFGIESVAPKINYSHVRDHIREVIAKIAPHDSIERFESLGVTVVQHTAEFIEPNAVIAGPYLVRAKRFVIAAGSKAAIPPTPGIEDIKILTNETIFDLTEKPEHLIIIGGGPIGCEIAQAHLHLGTKVSLLEQFSILPKDDSDCVAVVKNQLLQNGLVLHESTQVIKISKNNNYIEVEIKKNNESTKISGSHIFVSAGRTPNIKSLNLEKANVNYNKHGILVDKRLRTSNKKIYAIGDVAGSYQFTHAASYHAGIAIRNIVFHLPAKVNYQAMPWVTYTTPEIAHVGLNEKMAEQQNVKYKILKFAFTEIDRNVAEHETEGFIKVLVNKKGKILGATIVGEEAGELIVPWVLAISQGLKIKAIASMIIPYPTRSDIHKRVASEFYTPTLYSNKMQKIVRFLAKF